MQFEIVYPFVICTPTLNQGGVNKGLSSVQSCLLVPNIADCCLMEKSRQSNTHFLLSPDKFNQKLTIDGTAG